MTLRDRLTADVCPPRSAFTATERRVIDRCATPASVQHFLNRLEYNTEPPPGGPTQRSFRTVIRTGSAHCLEAALAAAVILEQHGYPPLVMSLESIDELDHVLFVYRARGRWGSIGRSRDPGLHGRKPVFATARALALSYVDPYIDLTGLVTGYAVADLRDLGRYDWRLANTNVWKVERYLLEYPHRQIRVASRREGYWRTRYRHFKAEHPDDKPVFYTRRDRWSALPPEWRR